MQVLEREVLMHGFVIHSAVLMNSLDQDSGILSGIQYGDITETFEYDQVRFLKARKGSKHTACEINMGLRGWELLPAIFRDFQCWLSMRPDLSVFRTYMLHHLTSFQLALSDRFTRSCICKIFYLSLAQSFQRLSHRASHSHL
jgi:hypothetical protein